MTKLELKLIQKIGAARAALEKLGQVRHSSTCMVDMDPDYMGPCSCGASKNAGKYYEVLRLLSLDDIADD